MMDIIFTKRRRIAHIFHLVPSWRREVNRIAASYQAALQTTRHGISEREVNAAATIVNKTN